MSFKTVKLRWAKKLLQAKMFVVLTEKESAIAIDGADPYSFTDAIALAAQAAELEMFHDSLGKLIKDHQNALSKLTGGSDVPKSEDVKTAATASRKIDAKPTTEAGKQSGPVQATHRSKSSEKKTPQSKSTK